MKEINSESLEEVFELLKEREKVSWFSDYKFLSEHKGHRPGALHLYLGVAHGGKSTLMRSLIIDALKRCDKDKKVLVWLSEETENDFLIEFSMALKTMAKEDARTLLRKLLIHSEMNYSKLIKKNDLKTKYAYFRETIHNSDINLIFFDNLTTSEFYMDRSIDDQSYFIKSLKEEVAEAKKPFIMVAHTGADMTENSHRLINMNDIRGCKSVINLVQFCYILQRFQLNDFYYPTLRITKHRGQTVENKMFNLQFDKEKNLYVKDYSINFLELKDNFKKRNVL